MRLVHFSDTHLDFRQFDRLTPAGINVREADVARSFNAVIDKTIALAPELVVIGGDIFHAVRPTNRSIVHAYDGLRRLTAALPHTAVVMVAGNHDTPRTIESGTILRLFDRLGVHVVDAQARVIDLPQFDCSVLGVADSQHVRPELKPSANRRFNVLVMHGETGGISGKWTKDQEIPDEDLHAEQWDYIALGHYHVYRQVAPNAYYSGAIDYTSSNIWGEHAEEAEAGLAGKGIVERDLVTGAQTFHSLPRTRAFVDLPPISAHDKTPAEVDEAIEAAVDACEGGIDGKVVRLIVHDISRETGKSLDFKRLNVYRRRALHFKLDQRRPEVVYVGASAEVHDLVRRRAPLDQLVAQMLRERPLPTDVNRDELVALGGRYLAEAEAKEATRFIVAPVSEEAVAVARKALTGIPDEYGATDGVQLSALPESLQRELAVA